MLERPQLFGLLIVWSAIVGSSHASGMGVVHNASFVMPYFGTIMNASSCNECLCAMFSPSMNSSILSLNCIDENSNGVICQLFNHTITSSSNNSQIKISLRSTFYFQLLPVGDPSESTLVPRLTSTTVTTQEGAYLTFTRKKFFDAFLPVLEALPFLSVQTSLIRSLPGFWNEHHREENSMNRDFRLFRLVLFHNSVLIIAVVFPSERHVWSDWRVLWSCSYAQERAGHDW